MGCGCLGLRLQDRHVSSAEDLDPVASEKTKGDFLKSRLQNMGRRDDKKGVVDRNENAASLQPGLRTVVIEDRNSS